MMAKSTAGAPLISPGDYRTFLILDDFWPVIVVDDMTAAEFSPDPRRGMSAVPVLVMCLNVV